MYNIIEFLHRYWHDKTVTDRTGVYKTDFWWWQIKCLKTTSQWATPSVFLPLQCVESVRLCASVRGVRLCAGVRAVRLCAGVRWRQNGSWPSSSPGTAQGSDMHHQGYCQWAYSHKGTTGVWAMNSKVHVISIHCEQENIRCWQAKIT